MIQPGILHEVPQRSREARLRIGGAEHDPVQPRQHGGTGAHRARLQGDRERAAVEAPRSEIGCSGAQSPTFNDSSWSIVDVPHTWNNLDGQDGGSNYYRGIGWYRHPLNLTAAEAAKELVRRLREEARAL